MQERYQVTLSPMLVKAARQIMKSEGWSSLSAFLESLIREEAKRRGLLGHPPSITSPYPYPKQKGGKFNDEPPKSQ